MSLYTFWLWNKLLINAAVQIISLILGTKLITRMFLIQVVF